MLINTTELVPQYIEKIFDALLKGNFINENSSKQGYAELYNVIDNQEAQIRAYFKPFRYNLIRRAGYFYFVHDSENQSNATLEMLVDYIDIANFLKTVDSNFQVAFKFKLSSIENKLSDSLELQDLAFKMKGINAKDNREFVQKIVDKLRKNGFVEEHNSKHAEYIVLNSYDYVEQLLREVEIYE
jgi:hypothetical protein